MLKKFSKKLRYRPNVYAQISKDWKPDGPILYLSDF